MDSFKTQVEEIIESNVNDKWTHFSTKYRETFARYPKLMRMACETTEKSSFHNRFQYFMKLKQTIDVNEITHDQADIIAGEHLAEEYLPNLK